jgi:transcriptional regulator of acetoin/glycerol metabolism
MSERQRKGGYRKSDFGTLVKTDPKRAAQLLTETWTKEGGSTKAAKQLNISRSSFFRCIRRLTTLGYTVLPPVQNVDPGIDTRCP